MARKEKEYHYIYKTTNLKNGKYYVGMHSTDNIEDGYMGSGKRLRSSLKRHGKENFKFEILEFLPDRISLKEREKELVNEELIKDIKSMNLKLGGEGGLVSEEHMKKLSKAGNVAFIKKLNEDEDYKKNWSLKSSETIKRSRDSGKINYYNSSYLGTLKWKGEHHTEESKKKIGEKNSIRQSGSGNSQFGTCWITNGNENKKIKKEEINNYLCNGWNKGRK